MSQRPPLLLPALLLPATESPCRCNVNHRPQPRYTHRHHIWPLYAGGPDIEANIAHLCPAGHDIVHHTLRRFERDKQVVHLRINRYLFGIAVDGWKQYNP